MQQVATLDLGHGRIEQRQLWALPIDDDYLNWPTAQTMLRLQRTITDKKTGEQSVEIAYALSSLDLMQASAADLLQLWRGHWQIENRLHYVKDVTMGEDASRIRSGHGPQVMSAFRNLALSLMRMAGYNNIKDALHTYAQFPYRALGLLVYL